MTIRLILVTGIALAVAAVNADSTTPAERGAALLAPFKTGLKTALVQGMQQGPDAAIEICSDEAPNIARGLSTDGVAMGRSSHKLRNPANAAPDWVAPILAAYAAGQKREPVAVEYEDGRFGYVEPIMVQPLCVTCHGENLSPDVAATISELYPEDQATGFSAGDFRGVFWVSFPAD